MDRRRARQVATAAQVAAGVLLIGGVAGAMVLPRTQATPIQGVSFGDLDTEVARKVAEAEKAKAEATPTESAFPPDFIGIAERVAMASDIPVKEDEPEEPVVAGPDGETPGAEVPAATTEPVSPSRVRYLGSVKVGDKSVALVAADQKQAFIAEGAKKTIFLGGAAKVEVEVLRVSEDEVELLEDGSPRTVTLGERQSAVVSASPPATPTPKEDPAQAARDSSRARAGLSDEEARANASRALDPENFRRADGSIDNEALREAARARREEILSQRRGEPRRVEFGNRDDER
jgi:hypothetical protein